MYLSSITAEIEKKLKTSVYQATLKNNDHLEVAFLNGDTPDTLKFIFSNFQAKGKSKFKQELARFEDINANRSKISEDVRLIDLTNEAQVVLRKQI